MIRILVRGIPTYFHFCLPCFLSLILYFREYFPVQFIRSLHLYLKAIAITTIITTHLKFQPSCQNMIHQNMNSNLKINNPSGFSLVQKYIQNLFLLVQAYDSREVARNTSNICQSCIYYQSLIFIQKGECLNRTYHITSYNYCCTIEFQIDVNVSKCSSCKEAFCIENKTRPTFIVHCIQDKQFDIMFALYNQNIFDWLLNDKTNLEKDSLYRFRP